MVDNDETSDGFSDLELSGPDSHEEEVEDLPAEVGVTTEPQSIAFQMRLPAIDPDDLTGELVVIEGPDGSGRSTQIQLLTEWLEWNGYGVQTMGLRRSRLLAENIDELLGRNDVQRTTLALLYATDFYDQLTNSIVPALRSGFVVLADRYVYTLVARAVVRGLAGDYLRNVYDFAVDPDLAFRVEVDPAVAFERIFEKQQAISYWEAGGDLNLSDNLYESFLEYQSRLREVFDEQADRWGFESVNGEASVQAVNEQLRAAIGEHLGIADVTYEPSEQFLPVWNK